MNLFATFLEKPNGDRGMLLIAKETLAEAVVAHNSYLDDKDITPLLPLAQLPVPFYLTPDDEIFGEIGDVGDMVYRVANNGCFNPPSMMV